jgi:NAD(P)-dependent dehydrogenase (short-subunit alcohol dehydrogenase family)
MLSPASPIQQQFLRPSSVPQPRIGPINALINNAGVNVFHEPLETSDAEWQRCFDINLKGAWNCSKAVLPGMIGQGGGVILNIASTHAFTIIPHTFPYPVAKHALLGMTKSLGIEYAPKGVRVNALAPGYVLTQKATEYWNSFPDPVAARSRDDEAASQAGALPRRTKSRSPHCS